MEIAVSKFRMTGGIFVEEWGIFGVVWTKRAAFVFFWNEKIELLYRAESGRQSCPLSHLEKTSHAH